MWLGVVLYGDVACEGHVERSGEDRHCQHGFICYLAYWWLGTGYARGTDDLSSLSLQVCHPEVNLLNTRSAESLQAVRPMLVLIQCLNHHRWSAEFAQVPKSVCLPISEAGREPQLPRHRALSDNCSFEAVWCSWWFSLSLLLRAQKRDEWQSSLRLGYLWRMLRSSMNLSGYLESAHWASTSTSLLVISVQIFQEKTNWLISITIMPCW